MLTVWLVRLVTVDLAEHLARAKGSVAAARLDPALRRRLGVGNSTGLGMAPFLMRHPALLHAWIAAREKALARVRALPGATPEAAAGLRRALAEARANAALWRSEHPAQFQRLADLRRDLDAIAGRIAAGLPGDQPWDALWRWGEVALSEEEQEALLSLLLEPQGALVDDLAGTLCVDEDASFAIDGAMTIGALGAVLAGRYAWATGLDFADEAATARFWYVSEDKLEPRLGERHAEGGAEREQPLDTARAVAALSRDLGAWAPGESVGAFLRAHPGHRHTVRRVQTCASHPYAEIRDNLIGRDMLPIDILRCKLAFFGATRFDPRSDRWVRISLFQGEPHPDEVGAP